MDLTEQGFPPSTEAMARVYRLQVYMAENEIDGALILQNADLIYFCGTTQAEAVFIPSAGWPVLLGKPPLERLIAEAPWAKVIEWPKGPVFKGVLEAEGRKINRLGLELDVLPVLQFRRYEKIFSGAELVDVSEYIRRIRSIKSEFELNLMKKAAKRLDRLMEAVPILAEESRTEIELEGHLTGLARMDGYQGLIRSRGFNMELALGHVLSGENGLVQAKVASPTGGEGIGPGFGQGAGFKELRPDELISVDICTTFGGYTADQTRLFHAGKPDERLDEVYDGLLRVITELNQEIRPGIEAERVYYRAFTLAKKHGISKGFMGFGAGVCPFIGHGVGIELDEWPVLAKGSKTLLSVDMVYALEPRVFVPGLGVVGLEDTYHLTKDGPVALTNAPRRITEITLAG